jgi:hypothetical protein
MVFRWHSIPCIVLATVLSGCGETKYVDVSAQPGYRDIVGATYTVKGPMTAYGIRKHSKAAVEYVSVVPAPGIDGPEVGFRLPIAIGSTVTVNSVYESNRIFDPSISLGVKLNGAAMPKGLPIRIDLMRGIQGTDKLSLNPALFQRN